MVNEAVCAANGSDAVALARFERDGTPSAKKQAKCSPQHGEQNLEQEVSVRLRSSRRRHSLSGRTFTVLDTDSEWEKRSKTRALEMEACSEALEFLTSDSAHDLFTKTFNFVQDSTFPEAACRTYKKRESSGAVTGMIQQSWE